MLEHLLKLPEDIFLHCMDFYEPRTGSAKVMDNFMRHMREVDQEISRSIKIFKMTGADLSIVESFEVQNQIYENTLRDEYKTSKAALPDWLICGYHKKYENNHGTMVCRHHFSRLGEIWDFESTPWQPHLGL